MSTTAIIVSRFVTSGSQSEAAGIARPVAEYSHWAAAAFVWVFPSASGWNAQLGRLWSYSWGRGPRCQPAAAGSAAKASVFRTLYSLEAWPAGRHKEQSQCFYLPTAFLLLSYMEINPEEAPWNSLFSNVFMTQNMKEIAMKAERLIRKL